MSASPATTIMSPMVAACSLLGCSAVTDVEELLDGPLDDPAALRGNLRDLERVNRGSAAWRCRRGRSMRWRATARP